jgi:hypothetical protein
MGNWYLGWRKRLPGGFSIGWRRRLFGSRRRGIGSSCLGLLLAVCCLGACVAALPKTAVATPTPQHAAATATFAVTQTLIQLLPATARPINTPLDTATPAPSATVADTATRQPAASSTKAPIIQSTATTALVVLDTATAEVVQPTATQETAPTDTQAAPPASGGYVCPNGGACIKGNISGDGRKLYHFPGCPSYNTTKIDTSTGERWFTSAAEAEAAGWVKASNCP